MLPELATSCIVSCGPAWCVHVARSWQCSSSARPGKFVYCVLCTIYKRIMR